MAHDDMQAPPLRADGLQIEERRDYQRRLWTLERFGWAAFGLVVAVALLGLTGGGGVFDHRAVRVPGAEADVPLIARWQASDDMTVRFDGGAPLVIALDRGFLDHFDLTGVQPRPVSSVAEAGGLTLRFEAGGAPPFPVRLTLRPTRPGIAAWGLRVGGHRRDLVTLVLP